MSTQYAPPYRWGFYSWVLSSDIEYRRLRPDSRMEMTHKAQSFELAFKHRELKCAPYDALQKTISRLYRRPESSSGLAQCAALTGCPRVGRDRRCGVGVRRFWSASTRITASPLHRSQHHLQGIRAGSDVGSVPRRAWFESWNLLECGKMPY